MMLSALAEMTTDIRIERMPENPFHPLIRNDNGYQDWTDGRKSVSSFYPLSYLRQKWQRISGLNGCQIHFCTPSEFVFFCMYVCLRERSAKMGLLRHCSLQQNFCMLSP